MNSFFNTSGKWENEKLYGNDAGRAIGVRAGGLGGLQPHPHPPPPQKKTASFSGEFFAKFRGIWALRQWNCTHTVLNK